MGLMDEYKKALLEGDVYTDVVEELKENVNLETEEESRKWFVMLERWKNSSGKGKVVNIEEKEFKVVKEGPCFLCKKKPDLVTFKYNGDSWDAPDTHVGRIDPEKPYEEGNVVGLCSSCSRRVKGRHLYEYVTRILGQEKMAYMDIIKNNEGVEEAKKAMLSEWRALHREEQKKQWWL